MPRKKKSRKARKPRRRVFSRVRNFVARKRGVSLKFGRRRVKRAYREISTKAAAKKVKPANIKRVVEAKLKGFEKAHEEVKPEPPKLREQDEHVDFEHVKKHIEKTMKDRDMEKTYRPVGKKETLELIKSGVKGLDEILGGGIPKDSLVLLSGTCGTGKSIFAMNFLIDGALMGEPGVYISLEESPETNIKQMKLFGWPIDELVKKKRLLIIQPELYNFDALLTTIEDGVNRINAKRLVIDSASIIGMYFEDPYKVRKSLLQLGTMLKKLDCTTIAIDEIAEGKPTLSAFGVEEFVADGVIILYLIKRGNLFIRACVVRKMRNMNHSTKIHPMEIKSPGGIIVYPSQELFEEIR
jgi:KaiC/GvpD/RAD55 family RecA-like ATPase